MSAKIVNQHPEHEGVLQLHACWVCQSQLGEMIKKEDSHIMVFSEKGDLHKKSSARLH